jgi:hypothetical protein
MFGTLNPPSHKEMCAYYPNGSLLSCIPENISLCWDTNDKYLIINPLAWNITDQPLEVINETLPLAKPIIGITFITFFTSILMFLMFHLVFRAI